MTAEEQKDQSNDKKEDSEKIGQSKNKKKDSKKQKKDQSNDNEKYSENKAKYRPAEFRLVLWMLLSLTILLVLLISLPFIVRNESKNSDFIEYSKWVLPALLGTFGAWIGAGAAYYFGKENLKLSSESTKEALEIQGDTSKFHTDNATIKDINPTPLNPSFMFSINSEVTDVGKELDRNVDYWFIPVLEDDKIEDVIHIEALWRFYRQFYRHEEDAKNKKISELIEYIETDDDAKKKLSKLHGFFEEFTMDDHLSDSLKLMKKYNASVGIVCDDQGNATHCFTRRDLKTFMLGSS